MSKNEFLDRLCQGLRFNTSAEEIQRTVMFYSEAIDDRMEDGMTEEEAVADMGDVEKIIGEIRGTWEDRGNFSSGDTNESTGGTTDPGPVHLTFSPERVTRLEIYDTSGDVEVCLSPDHLIHIDYTATSAWHYELTPGPTLTLRRSRNTREEEPMSFDIFGYKFSIPRANLSGLFDDRLGLRVAVPAGETEVSVNVAGGDVSLSSLSLKELSVRSVGGDIDLRDLECTGKASLVTASGDVEISRAQCPELSAVTASGDIGIEGSAAARLRVKTASGDIDLEGVSARGSLSLVTVSGDIDANLAAPSGEAHIEAVSGDIELTFPGPPYLYTLSVRSTSGDVHAPAGALSGPNNIRAKTLSGDISVRFEG